MTLGQTAGVMREAYERDGFVVFPGLLDSEEIARLRRQTVERLHRGCRYTNLGKTLPNAAVEAPEVGWIFHHPRILDAIRALIGDRIVFTSQCDLHMNMVSGWHNDCGGDPSYFDADPFTLEDVRVAKVALYLQDHHEGSGGLTVRPGTHLGPGKGDGREVPIRTSAGDLIVFDVRLDHCGKSHAEGSTRLMYRALGRLGLLQSRISYLAHTAQFRLTGRPDRVSAFFTFGVDNQHTYVFACNNMRRQINQTRNDRTRLDEDLAGKLTSQGVLLAETRF